GGHGGGEEGEEVARDQLALDGGVGGRQGRRHRGTGGRRRPGRRLGGGDAHLGAEGAGDCRDAGGHCGGVFEVAVRRIREQRRQLVGADLAAEDDQAVGVDDRQRTQ